VKPAKPLERAPHATAQPSHCTYAGFRPRSRRAARIPPELRRFRDGCAALLQASPAALSAERLLEQARDENANPFTNAVRVTIARLRRKLDEPEIIQTTPGVGYRVVEAPCTTDAPGRCGLAVSAPGLAGGSVRDPLFARHGRLVDAERTPASRGERNAGSTDRPAGFPEARRSGADGVRSARFAGLWWRSTAASSVALISVRSWPCLCLRGVRRWPG
jgi:hypothetical protein